MPLGVPWYPSLSSCCGFSGRFTFTGRQVSLTWALSDPSCVQLPQNNGETEASRAALLSGMPAIPPDLARMHLPMGRWHRAWCCGFQTTPGWQGLGSYMGSQGAVPTIALAQALGFILRGQCGSQGAEEIPCPGFALSPPLKCQESEPWLYIKSRIPVHFLSHSLGISFWGMILSCT